MVHARDDLVLLQETVEQPAAARVGHVAQHLERDAVAATLAFREINRRQVARSRASPRRGASSAPFSALWFASSSPVGVEALDLELAAHDLDQPLVLDAVLREEIRGAGLQRVDGEKLVALGGEQQHRRTVARACTEPLEELRPSRPRDGMAEQDEVDVRSGRSSSASGPPELG